MRILHIMPGINGEGGAEHSFMETAAVLGDHGVDLHLGLLTERQDHRTLTESLGVTVHDLSTVGTTLVQRIRAIRRLVARLEPDLIHATLFDATVPTQLASIGLDKPVLITWANTSYSEQRLRAPGVDRRKVGVLRIVERLTNRLSRSFFHAVTDGVARSNGTALRVDRSRIFVAERGRGDMEPRANRGNTGSLREQLGVEPHQDVVLAVGRQEHQKGHADLIAQFDHVHEATGAALLIAGRPGSATPAIEDTLSRVRHPGAVHLLGQRNDIPELLALASVFVLPSLYEGAAGAAIEAMASGTPIVSSRLDGLEGVLVPDRTAVIAERDELGKATVSLLKDPERCERLSMAAHDLYMERFTRNRAAESLLEVYRRVIEAARHRR